MQFWNATSGNVEIKFLSANDLLVESDSANAETIFNYLVTALNNCELTVDHLIALCADGASVMPGKKQWGCSKAEIAEQASCKCPLHLSQAVTCLLRHK